MRPLKRSTMPFLGPPRRNEAMIDAELGAALIEAVRSGRPALAVGSEAVGECLGVVGQDRVDRERRRLVQRLEKTLSRACALVGHQLHVDPACGAVDGHESVAALVLVAHLREVLDVDGHEARLIGFEGLGRRPGPGLGLQVRQPGDAVAPQHAIQRRAAHGRFDEFPHHRQQIVQGQAQRRAQIQHQRFLAVVQRLGQPMRRVTAIRRRRAAPPFPDGVPRRTEARR